MPKVVWILVSYRHTWSFLALIMLGGILRFGNLFSLSLWLDEGATIHFAALSWWKVLGLDGRYDLHPPLYYALVKLITPLASQAMAGRLVSAVAGTLTVGIVYIINYRLLNWRAGIAAGLLLAVSPLHIWYSQEGRMYALATFFVALTALALIGFHQSVDRLSAQIWWAVLFGVVTSLAAYSVYSAFYTLIPFGIALVWLVLRHRQRAAPLLVASVVAVALYFPWLPQLLRTTATVQGDPALLQGREDLLAANAESVGGSLLSLSGVGGTLGVMANSQPLFWSRWPIAHAALLLILICVVVVGVVIASRCSLLAAILSLSFLIGTVLVAIGVSRVSPGYADRTILSAVVGWSMLAGSLVFTWRPHWLGSLGLVSFALILAITLNSLVVVRSSGWKQPYRDLISDTARVASLGQPIVPLSSWMPSFFEAYAPLIATTVIIDANGKLLLPVSDNRTADVFWLAYADNPWDAIEAVRKQLVADGYERRLHKYYRRNLYLDLYVRSDAQFGSSINFDGNFVSDMSAPTAPHWIFPADGAKAFTDELSRSTLTLSNSTKSERFASIDVPVNSGSVITLEFSARNNLSQESFGASLTCLNATGSPLELESNEGAQNILADQGWHTARTATFCPGGTVKIRISLRNSGIGEISFRGLRLYEAVVPPENR